MNNVYFIEVLEHRGTFADARTAQTETDEPLLLHLPLEYQRMREIIHGIRQCVRGDRSQHPNATDQQEDPSGKRGNASVHNRFSLTYFSRLMTRLGLDLRMF